ncbi:hypothetical protein [Christiangramia sabulilitoris]|uniref:Uncharacterized protein n=1 Tax=Christiangramia sabulilitoris TaxID=2583991 RepID=A0A550I7F6_9FLAO|nr:hypothetical protein [Christiangramia sabulilitoris]TRO66758.1 hypothetical protein FGM01_02385 [Christiangramia sabulilitoris]
MPELIIKRNSEWASKFKPFEIYLNAEKFIEIHDGQLLNFTIPEGNYTLFARVGWCRSETINFHVEKDEIRRIEIRGFLFSEYLLPVALLTGTIYFGLYFGYNYNSLALGTLLMFYFGYLIYFITFGRKQFLRLILK